MRVVHFRKSFSPLTETFIYDTVRELERQGVASHVLTGQRLHEAARPFDAVTVLGWPSVWNPERLLRRLLVTFGHGDQEATAWPQVRAEAERHLLRLRPDVVHAHFGTDGALIAPVARALGLPLVVTFYGYDVSALPTRAFWRHRYRELWETVAAVTVLSDEMRRAVVALGCPPALVTVVHLSRDLTLFPYRPPRDAVRTFVSVGRLTEKKGTLDAVRAFEQVLEAGHAVRLRIVGDGPLERTLGAYVRARGLADRVHLLGALPNDRVARELEEADAFVLCSKTAADGDREGTPTVLVEAQAIGLPCVATRHAGIPEMVPEANHALLAGEGDVDDIARKMLLLLSYGPGALAEASARGRAHVEQAFNLNRETERFRALYGHVATRAGADEGEGSEADGRAPGATDRGARVGHGAGARP